MPYKDPIKRRKYNIKKLREHYRKNKAKYLERQREYRKAFVRWLDDEKARRKAAGCAKCPEKHISCLQFHHPNHDGVKRGSSFSRVRLGSSKSRAIAELDKTIVLCANCHLKEHFELKTGPWREKKDGEKRRAKLIKYGSKALKEYWAANRIDIDKL